MDGSYCCDVCGGSHKTSIKLNPIVNEFNTIEDDLYQVNAISYLSRDLIERVADDSLSQLAQDTEREIARIFAEYLLDHIKYQIVSDSKYGAIKLSGQLTLQLGEPNSAPNNDLAALLKAWKTMHSVMSKPGQREKCNCDD